MESKPPFQDMPTLIDCLNAQLCRMVFSPKDEWFLREMDDKSSRYSALKIPLQRNPPIDVATEEDRLELVEHHKDVFIVTVPDAIGGFLSLMKDRCAIALIKDQWDDVVSMPFHKNDEYGEKFNRELLTLEELGITKKIIAQYTINNDCASLGRVRKPTAPPVPLRLALGAIIILACGCLFALLTLGTENFSYYCLPKRL